MNSAGTRQEAPGMPGMKALRITVFFLLIFWQIPYYYCWTDYSEEIWCRQAKTCDFYWSTFYGAGVNLIDKYLWILLWTPALNSYILNDAFSR
jgi:hypothetical protein